MATEWRNFRDRIRNQNKHIQRELKRSFSKSINGKLHYMCQRCRKFEESVEIHHVIPIGFFDDTCAPELLSYRENMIVLCTRCHRKEHELIHFQNRTNFKFGNSFDFRIHKNKIILTKK